MQGGCGLYGMRLALMNIAPGSLRMPRLASCASTVEKNRRTMSISQSPVRR